MHLLIALLLPWLAFFTISRPDRRPNLSHPAVYLDRLDPGGDMGCLCGEPVFIPIEELSWPRGCGGSIGNKFPGKRGTDVHG